MAGTPSGLSNLPLRDQLRVDRLPLRLAQMMVGLTGFGLSLAMLLRSGLGGAPWDVFHAALAHLTGLSVGTMSIAVSFLVLLLWIPLREQVGIGTIANSIWVGVSIDVGLLILPPAANLPLALVLMVAGVGLNGVSAAVYIGAQLGPGPRDGLMTGLARRLVRTVGPVRIVLEVIILSIGWGLGGPVGVGTLVYAIALGPMIQLVLPQVIMPVRSPLGPAPTPATEAEPPGDPA